MDNENNQNTNEGSDTNSKKHDEDIPLWLQGLEDSEDEDTNPINLEVNVSDSDQSEVNTGASAKDQSADQHPAEDIIENDIPEWLNELAETEPNPPEPSDEQGEISSKEFASSEIISSPSMESEEPEEFREIEGEFPEDDTIENPAESPEDFPFSDENPKQPDPEEIELTDSFEETQPEETDDDEDLPTWLTEMIMETPEGSKEDETFPEEDLNLEPEFQNAPIEDIDIDAISQAEDEFVEDWVSNEEKIDEETGSKIDKESSSDEEVISEPSATDWVPEESLFDPNEPGSGTQQTGLSEPSIEEDTQPVIAASNFEEGKEQETEEEAPSVDEECEVILIADDQIEIESKEQIDAQALVENDQETASEEQPLEGEERPIFDTQTHSEEETTKEEDLPDPLREAKTLLDEGETSEAIDIIRYFEDKTDYLQEIQTWLEDSVKSSQKENLACWELLGDIALENEQAEIALNAYAKAMELLLSNKGEQDEIS